MASVHFALALAQRVSVRWAFMCARTDFLKQLAPRLGAQMSQIHLMGR